MKYFILTISLFLVLACSNRKEYSAEEYKQKQKDYEIKKADFSKGLEEDVAFKKQYLLDNKGRMQNLIELLETLASQETSFDSVNSDTTFVMEDVVMDPVNFGIQMGKHTQPSREADNAEKSAAVPVIFINKGAKELSGRFITDYMEDLSFCMDYPEDVDCMKMDIEKLKSYLSIEYAFIVDELLSQGPSIKDNESFDGGMYLASITCYEIATKTPIYKFNVVAGSSDEIQSNKVLNQSIQDNLDQDFRSNIKNEILASCRKHFLFVDGIMFIANF